MARRPKHETSFSNQPAAHYGVNWKKRPSTQSIEILPGVVIDILFDPATHEHSALGFSDFSRLALIDTIIAAGVLTETSPS